MEFRKHNYTIPQDVKDRILKEFNSKYKKDGIYVPLYLDCNKKSHLKYNRSMGNKIIPNTFTMDKIKKVIEVYDKKNQYSSKFIFLIKENENIILPIENITTIAEICKKYNIDYMNGEILHLVVEYQESFG